MIALTPAGASNTQNFLPSVTDMAGLNPSLFGSEHDGDMVQAPDLIAGELASEFAMVDPSLAAFHGDLRVAAAELALAKQSGRGIAQALSKFETAESLYQTRLLEVRGGKLAMDIASDETAEEDTAALRALSMQQKMDEQFAALRKKRMAQKRRREEQQQYSWLFYFLIGMWIAQMHQQRQNDFRQNMKSQMNRSFMNAGNKA